MNTAYQPSSSLIAKIKRKALPLRARRTLHFKITKPVISFTFDDFPRSAIVHGSDILERQNWKATFYLASGLAEINNHHGLHFKANDILDLAQKGHEIAGHTYTHIDCDKLGLLGTLAEINRNARAVKSMGHAAKIDHFAYPFGAANAALKRGLQNHFKSMRGVRTGIHHGHADLNDLKSSPLYSGPALEKVLDLIRDLKSHPGWLILFAHDIRDTPSEWGCTPAEFKHVVQMVKQSGANVLPIDAALKFLKTQAS